MQSLSPRQYANYLAKLKIAGTSGSQEYELIAQDIINKGGVKAMKVEQITETNKRIKDKMDIEIREILACF